MSTDTLDSPATRLAAVVRRTRRSLVATVLAAGLLLAVAIALAWVVGGVVLDLAMPLSVPARQAVWCGWWAAVVAACGMFLVAPATRWPLLDAVALRIERVIGDTHNQLLTVVDLARRQGSEGALLGPDGRVLRPDMVQRLLEQTQERIADFRPARVVPWRTLLRNLAIAAAVVGCIALLNVGLGERFHTTLGRLLHPTADIPPATWLQLQSPGDIDVLEGEPLEIRGRVVRGSIDAATLVIYDTTGRPSRQPMRSDGDGDFVAVLDGLDHAVRFRLEAGNTWTKTHSITLLNRPEIRSLGCRVRLPEYMRIDSPLAIAADTQQIEAPEGSTVEFTLTASPEAASGALRLAVRSLARDVVERFDDRVWFEDDLPRDAVSDAPWRWTTAHAAGGLRSFACGTDERPFAMKTRLEPLVLPREQPDSRAFSLMARLDPADPPTRLTVLLEHGQTKTELVWGDAPAAQPPAGTTRVAAGPLPRPAAWERLAVPMKSLGHMAGQAVTGGAFMVDRGRALLDRPGWLERSEDVVTRPVDTAIGEIPLVAAAAGDEAARPTEQRPGDGLWSASVPVDTPVWVTAELKSAQGHATLPIPPIEIVPTVDRPPSIVVDAMPETLVLKAAHDVPLAGRGFDDWGIDEVCVLAGPDPARLEIRMTLQGVSPVLRPPVAQLPIATAISAETLGLAAGASAVWKLRIRDTKGQVAETKLFRVTVLTPPESDLAKTQVPALAQARREAEQLAREAAKKADEVDAGREAVRSSLAADEAPTKKLVDELAARLDRERRMADQVAKAVEKAAEQADRSELVPKRQKDMLVELAEEARSLEHRLAGEPSQKRDAKPEEQAATQDAAAKQASASQPPATPAQKASAAKAARVAESPTQREVKQAAMAITERLEDVARRLDAQGAALQIDSLTKDLERRAERLADASQPQVVDAAKTRQQVRDVEQILGRQLAPTAPRDKPTVDENADESPQTGPPTPATPSSASGSKDGGMERNAAASPTPSGAAEAATAAAETAAATAQLAARLADVAPPPAAKMPPATPRPQEEAAGSARDALPQDFHELLESDEVRQALAMAERARRLQAREAAQAEAAARAAAAAGRDRVGRKPADASRDASDRTSSTADADASASDAASEGGAMAGSTAIDSAGSLRGLDARQRAALYKLPPHIRDPLLEGMRQRGPTAYQGVIDTYFRQLGKDIPQ